MAYPKCIWKNEGKQFMQRNDLITGACPVYLNPPPPPPALTEESHSYNIDAHKIIWIYNFCDNNYC